MTRDELTDPNSVLRQIIQNTVRNYEEEVFERVVNSNNPFSLAPARVIWDAIIGPGAYRQVSRDIESASGIKIRANEIKELAENMENYTESIDQNERSLRTLAYMEYGYSRLIAKGLAILERQLQLTEAREAAEKYSAELNELINDLRLASIFASRLYNAFNETPQGFLETAQELNKAFDKLNENRTIRELQETFGIGDQEARTRYDVNTTLVNPLRAQLEAARNAASDPEFSEFAAGMEDAYKEALKIRNELYAAAREADRAAEPTDTVRENLLESSRLAQELANAFSLIANTLLQAGQRLESLINGIERGNRLARLQELLPVGPQEANVIVTGEETIGEFYTAMGELIDAGAEYYDPRIEGLRDAIHIIQQQIAEGREIAREADMRANRDTGTGPDTGIGDGTGGRPDEDIVTPSWVALYRELYEPRGEQVQRIRDFVTLLQNNLVTINEFQQGLRGVNLELAEIDATSANSTFVDQFNNQLARMIDGVTNFKHAAGNIVGDFFISFTDGFADAVGQAIVFGDELNQSFGETLEDIAKNALAALISGFIKLGAQMIATSVLAETIGSGTTASTLGQALIIGQAWAPAAALASLATLGGNAAVAQAGIASTIGLTRFLSFFRDGGENIMGPGGRRSDSIPAMISRGESVITADATRSAWCEFGTRRN